MRQPIQVAIYCVRMIKNGWEYLLLHRIPSGGDYWQAISGGVEDDEEYFTTARRELKEETGFEPLELQLIDYSYTFPVEDSMRKLYEQKVDLITEIVFLAIVKAGKDPTITPVEHDDFKWCRFEEAVENLYWPGNKKSIKHCEVYLKNRGERI
jgi:8-oxo-dGTP pyrophosphatase MutT (NUDIX family)